MALKDLFGFLRRDRGGRRRRRRDRRERGSYEVPDTEKGERIWIEHTGDLSDWPQSPPSGENEFREAFGGDWPEFPDDSAPASEPPPEPASAQDWPELSPDPIPEEEPDGRWSVDAPESVEPVPEVEDEVPSDWGAPPEVEPIPDEDPQMGSAGWGESREPEPIPDDVPEESGWGESGAVEPIPEDTGGWGGGAAAEPPPDDGKKGKKKRKAKKPKKEKKAKDGKKKGPPLLVLILAAALLALAAVGAALFILKPWVPKAPPEDTEQTQTEDGGEAPADGEEAPADGEETPTDGEEPPADGEEPPADGEGAETPKKPSAPAASAAQQPMSTSEALDYFGSLTPATLGLEGEDMSGYRWYSSGRNVSIDGVYCMEIMVYSENEGAGTNDMEGRYFLSKGSTRRLYRMDAEGNVVELPLSAIGMSE